jgi:hypothetical protein
VGVRPLAPIVAIVSVTVFSAIVVGCGSVPRPDETGVDITVRNKLSVPLEVAVCKTAGCHSFYVVDQVAPGGQLREGLDDGIRFNLRIVSKTVGSRLVRCFTLGPKIIDGSTVVVDPKFVRDSRAC